MKRDYIDTVPYIHVRDDCYENCDAKSSTGPVMCTFRSLHFDAPS